MSEAEIRRTLDVNVCSHFWTYQEFLPKMIEKNSGMVVSIASTMGYFTASRLSDYCASKHAVVGFHNAVRLEVILEFWEKVFQIEKDHLGYVNKYLFKRVMVNVCLFGDC